MPVETSAGAVFDAPIVRLPDNKGQLYQTDHLRNLEEAETRIRRALARSKNTQP